MCVSNLCLGLCIRAWENIEWEQTRKNSFRGISLTYNRTTYYLTQTHSLALSIKYYSQIESILSKDTITCCLVAFNTHTYIARAHSLINRLNTHTHAQRVRPIINVRINKCKNILFYMLLQCCYNAHACSLACSHNIRLIWAEVCVWWIQRCTCLIHTWCQVFSEFLMVLSGEICSIFFMFRKFQFVAPPHQ